MLADEGHELAQIGREVALLSVRLGKSIANSQGLGVFGAQYGLTKTNGSIETHTIGWSEKPSRNPLKKLKDVKQGALLLSAIDDRRPHFPIDDAFRDELPLELMPHLDLWRKGRGG
jgi:hypothetical protein